MPTLSNSVSTPSRCPSALATKLRRTTPTPPPTTTTTHASKPPQIGRVTVDTARNLAASSRSAFRRYTMMKEIIKCHSNRHTRIKGRRRRCPHVSLPDRRTFAGVAKFEDALLLGWFLRSENPSTYATHFV
ncbi:hypothetical protein GLYMA_18G185700v4 [Glycine max]|nr:hypothetical protein JHK84_050791 [Glycine max]KAH1155080.1 hypothetical protein GYH30_050397 [Glycine max]KRH00019.2 hypothetical protein GLYMA_18G185700v4 [Glycine max]